MDDFDWYTSNKFDPDSVHRSKVSDREKPLPVVCTGTCVADKDHAEVTIVWVGAGYGRFRLTFNQLQHLMFRLQKVHQEMNHMHFVARQTAPPAGVPETEPAPQKRERGSFCDQCGRDIDPATEYLTEFIAGRLICDDCVLKRPALTPLSRNVTS